MRRKQPPSTAKAQSNSIPEQSSADARKSTAEYLRDQLVLIGLLVFLIGLVETESYYAAFGVRYQSIDLPSFHLVYRGLTTVLAAWYLALPYVAAMAWFWFEERFGEAHTGARRIASAYALTLLLVLFGFLSAAPVGRRQARKDTTADRSGLPRVECIVLIAEPGDCKYRGFRHLLSSGDAIVIFQPVSEDQRSTFPHIIHLSAGGVSELRTSSIR